MHDRRSQWIHRAQLVATLLWLSSVVTALGIYVIDPGRFTAANIAAALRDSGHQIALLLLLVSVIRAFFLIPSTPFVLAGGLLLPDRPWTVLFISMLGIILSATLLYFFSELLGFRDHFRRLPGSTFSKLESALKGRFGFFYLVLWAFLPFAPTDAACYVAGCTRMSFGKFLAGIGLGELIICSFYVLAGQSIWQFLLQSWKVVP
ncbi:MAG: VTT domain-containing protein [Verrucomicrobiales bacterium]|nr:VTT domain-containing protein [Verrucomicrobiales bacterium]